MRDQGWELASLVQSRSQQTGNLLDDCFTGQEGTVLLGCTTQAVFSIPCCGSLLSDHRLHGSSRAEQMSTAHQHMTSNSTGVVKAETDTGAKVHTELLDKLLVLVQLLQVLNTQGINAQGLGLFTMLVVSQHTHLQ